MNEGAGISRRALLEGIAATPALLGLTRKSPAPIAGGFVDDAGATGHRLRDGQSWPTPARVERVRAVIVGAGIAGLAAGWWLRRRGFDDFVVLELERSAGGNARWGENGVSRFPWGAHYVPVPGRDATLLRTLFEDIGVLREGVWNERHLAFAPRERLLRHGEWQPDVEPVLAVPRWERAEILRFHEAIAELRATGAFTVPSAKGLASRGAQSVRALDSVSMASWLARERFRSPSLAWYVDYACRDDYGSVARDTSAWAGVHYFASRSTSEDGPLTWPEGNGFIVEALSRRIAPRVTLSAPVFRIAREGSAVRVFTPSVEYRAEVVVLAIPAFVAARVVEGVPARPNKVYSPWLTANLTLRRRPQDRRGAPPAWDNVIFGSPSLGYVDATHQSVRTVGEAAVWTYYHALSDYAPSDARRLLLRRGWSEWVEWILDDLSRAHADIRDCVARVDIMRMGHAMVRPVPGFLGSRGTSSLPSYGGRLLHAHSDAPGLSLFEEAHAQGVEAAERVLRVVGG